MLGKKFLALLPGSARRVSFRGSPAAAALLAALMLLLAACASSARPSTASALPERVTLTVMAAASLNGAFEQLGAQFEAAHAGVTVMFNFAGSQQLAQQLSQGAPADVFASANQKQMDVVIAAGRVEQDAARTFVQNRLVVVYPRANPAGLQGLADLAKDDLKLIFAAREAPVGQYTLDFLAKADAQGAYGEGYAEKVLANVVSYEENVSVVLTKVALGEADGGIIYTSDVSGTNARQVSRIEIPAGLNVTAAYPIAPLRDAAHADLAQQFIALVLSAPGQELLAGYGFIPANSP